AAADAHRKASELSPAPRAICPRELIRRAAIEPGPPLPGRWRRNLTAPWRSSHACENPALGPLMSPRVLARGSACQFGPRTQWLISAHTRQRTPGSRSDHARRLALPWLTPAES